MGERMVPANGQTTKTTKIFYVSFWLERLSILLQICTFTCNFCSRKGGRASIGYRASIWTYTVGGSFEKKVQSGATHLIRFYIALNWGEKWFLSSKVFERTQSRLVSHYFLHSKFFVTYNIHQKFGIFFCKTISQCTCPS